MKNSFAEESKKKFRKIHNDTKIDIRLPKEVVDELSLLADYRHSCKSSLAREIVMERVGLLRKDRDYRKYAKNLRKSAVRVEHVQADSEVSEDRDQQVPGSPLWSPPMQLDYPDRASQEIEERIFRNQELESAETR
jgi:hypothetical protein